MGKYAKLPYGEQRAGEWMEEQGIPITSRKTVTDIADRARRGGLLGGKNGTIITVTTAEQAASILNRLDKTPDGAKKPTKETIRSAASRLAGDGMFIILMANGALKEVRDLIKLFKDNGFWFEEPGKDSGPIISELLGSVDLSPRVRSELADYVGEQYDLLLPVVRSLSKLSKAEQRSLTWTDMCMRLAIGKGTVTPWGQGGQPGLSSYLKNGDVDGTVGYYQRMIEGGSLPIMFVGWLGRTITERAISLAMMRELGVSADDAAKSTATKGSVHYLAKDVKDIDKRCRSLTAADFLELARLTAVDMTLIRKRGKKNKLDDNGKPIKKVAELDIDGKPVKKVTGYEFDWVDCPIREALDDDCVGLRMVLRAAKTFSGDASCVRRNGNGGQA